MGVFVLVGVVFFLGLMVGCGQPPVKPLSEPLFRLLTQEGATGCSPATPNIPCRWDIDGAVDSLQVVEPNENPFQNCTACRFNQRIGIQDKTGARHDLYYRLPGDEVAPLTQGTPIKLVYIEGDNIGQGYAMLMRHSNGLLVFSVTSGAGGLLLGQESFGQFKLSEDGATEAGTEADNCGTKVYRDLLLETGSQTFRLRAGVVQEIRDDNQARYRVANINRYNWRGLICAQNETPFSYFLIRLAN
jgi:hypothetical protein